MSSLGASFRTHPTPAFPSGSQMQLLREESRRKPSGHTHVYPPRVLAHSPCWQRPPVAHSSTSARVEEASLGLLRPWQPSLEDKPLVPFCLLPCLTYTGSINSLETGWTRSIWATQSVGVPCGERRDRAGTGWQRDNQAVVKKDETGGAKRSEVWFEVPSQPPTGSPVSKVGGSRNAQKPLEK